jgi:hypothetical protein
MEQKEGWREARDGGWKEGGKEMNERKGKAGII